MMRLFEFEQFTNDLRKVYLFAQSDKFSFSHIDSLVRNVSEKIFIQLTPPSVFPGDINKEMPILNYGNSKVLKELIENGTVDRNKVYNQPENLSNAFSKINFHKKTEGLPFIPKTVFSKQEANALTFPIIAKTEKGSKGVGVQQFKTKEDLASSKDEYAVFSEKFDLKKEFRCLCVKGDVIFIAERIPMNEKALSLREGEDIFDRKGTLEDRSDYKWETVQMGTNGLPSKEQFDSICGQINNTLGLEFLGVDLGVGASGKLWCIEANTCPGLNKDQIVLLYEKIFEDFYKRKVNEWTQFKLDEFKKELIRSNEDPAKFSHAAHLGKKFYVYDKDQDNPDKKKPLLTVKFDIEKSFGKPLKSIKKENSMKENKIMRFEQFNLNEEETESKGEYSTEEMDTFINTIVDLIEWDNVTIMLPSDRHASHPCKSKEEVLETWEGNKKDFGKDAGIKWYIWNAKAGGSFNKPVKFSTQRYDKDSLLSMAKKHPDSIKDINISFTSKQQKEFGDYMSKNWTKGD